MKSFDVIFIGSGHACWHGALILKTLGKSVALVERDLVGGTCTNYGCDAKILLDSPFELVEALDRYKGIGVTGESRIDWPALMQYKKQYIGAMPAALAGLFAQFGFELIRGEAEFLDKNTIRVGEETYSAEYFVIGTGQNYIPMDIPGKEYFHDSREFLDLDDIPDHVTFVGAGIISMEFASLCLSLGRKVDIVVRSGAVLKEYPRDYVDQVTEKMKAQGANFVFNANVCCIEKTESGYALKTKEGLTIETDYILIAVGRRANVDGLGLDRLGIEYSERGIKVDEHLRTCVGNIYASGDVIDKKIPKLTPTAEFESNYIAMYILNPANESIRYPAVPNMVFTLPRIAQAGVTVAEAEAHPELYRVEKNPVGASMSWLNKNQRSEHFTFIFDKTNKLAGAAVFSDDAGMYIDLLTIIINEKLGLESLQKMIFAFPTQTYGLISALIPLFMKQ